MNSRILIYIILLIGILSYSCRTCHLEFKKYKSNSVEWYDRVYGILNGCKRIMTGSVLDLKNDSTFNRMTCGDAVKGRYTVEDDFLILSIDSIYLKNKGGFVINSKSNQLNEKYQIKCRRLILISDLKVKMDSGYKLVKAIEILR